MLRMYRRKRLVRRKRVARKRYARKPRSSEGIIRLTRRLPEQNLYNGGTAGVMIASGATVVVGTPYQTPAFTGSTYYNAPFTIDFALNDIINVSDLTQIADKYRINWVKIMAYCTSNTASSAGTAQLPSILWSTDDDDVGMPASTTTGLNTLREKMSSKIRQWKQNTPLKFFIKPKLLGSVSGPLGTPVQAVVGKAKFIDCNHPDVPHYGMKGYLQDVNLATTASVLTQFKFDIVMSVTLRGIQ